MSWFDVPTALVDRQSRIYRSRAVDVSRYPVVVVVVEDEVDMKLTE